MIMKLKQSEANSYGLPIVLYASVLILLISSIILTFPVVNCTRPNRLIVGTSDNTQDNYNSDDVVNNATRSFPSLFLFGDSLADTGNGPFVNKPGAMSYPYGITFPGYPFGRFSDGRIIADYLATYLSLPPLNAWLDDSLNFTHGANYAIPGASVLPNLSSPFPLSKQISWHLDLVQQVNNMTTTTTSRMLTQNMKVNTIFQEIKPNLPSEESLRESLYVLQFGVSDFKIFVIDYNNSVQWVIDNRVPLIIEETQNALEILYSDGGARNFVVVGSPAHGCISATLATLPNSAKDSHGCVASFNDIAWNHRQQLLILLQNLQELHADATYTFVDLFSAHIYIIENADEFGFTNVFDACCGAGDRYPYGFNMTEFPCSSDTTSLYLCQNPSDHINWDGSHFTTNFYDQLFNQTFLTKSFIHQFHEK